MVKLRKGRRTTGPSTAIGLMRFFDVESKAPKITPEFLIFGTLVFVAIIIILQKLPGLRG